MSLHAHVGGEFTPALGLAIKADRTIEVLIAAVVGELGGRISRFSDCAGENWPAPCADPT